MDITDPLIVDTIPLTQYELIHQSRTRNGYHVFVSMFWEKFKSLTLEGKEQRLLDCGIWNNAGVDDNTCIDSVLIPKGPSAQEVEKLEGITRRHIDHSVRESWKRRATRLNCRLIPGCFLSTPDTFNRPNAVSTV